MIIPIRILKDDNLIVRRSQERKFPNKKYANSIITWVCCVHWCFVCVVHNVPHTALRNEICINTTLSKIMSRIEMIFTRSHSKWATQNGWGWKRTDNIISKGKDVRLGCMRCFRWRRWLYRYEIDWYFSFDKRFYNSIKCAASFVCLLSIVHCVFSVECIHCSYFVSSLLFLAYVNGASYQRSIISKSLRMCCVVFEFRKIQTQNTVSTIFSLIFT